MPGEMTPWDQAIQLDNIHLAQTPGSPSETQGRDKPVVLMCLKSWNVCYISLGNIRFTLDIEWMICLLILTKTGLINISLVLLIFSICDLFSNVLKAIYY